MLSKLDDRELVHDLHNVIHQFVDSDSTALVDSIVNLIVPTLHLISDIAESRLAVADEGCCGPEPAPVAARRGSEVRCPHCGRFI